MPYAFEWIDEPHICKITLTGDVTPVEIEQWMLQVYGLMEKNPDPLHAVVDETSKPKIGFNAIKLEWVRRVANHKNCGWIVTVGASPLIAFWMEMLRRIARIKCTNFPTVAEAEAFVANIERIAVERATAPADKQAN